MQRPPTLLFCCIAEMLGTGLLIFLGCGAVHTAVTTGAIQGAWQVAIVWGSAVTLAAYAVGPISGAHINPAMTLALALWGDFPWNRLLPYWISQTAGAALAALLLHVIFSGTITAYEKQENIHRGSAGSEVTAAMYGEYFPNPTVSIHGAGAAARPENLAIPAAMIAEIAATAVLALCVFAVSDRRSAGAPGANLAPVFAGLAVAALVTVFGPMTQACLNPARDFGPRLVAYFAGWKEIAFPGPRGASATLLVYLVSPMAGAALGGFLYARVFGPRHAPEKRDANPQQSR